MQEICDVIEAAQKLIDPIQRELKRIHSPDETEHELPETKPTPLHIVH